MLLTQSVLGFDKPMMVMPVKGKTPMLGLFSGEECVLRFSLKTMKLLAAHRKQIVDTGEWGNARVKAELTGEGNYLLRVRNTEVVVYGMAFENLLTYAEMLS